MNLNFINTNHSNPLDDESTTEVCIANISPKERKKRLKFAITQLVLTLILLSLLIYLDLPSLWRLPLFFMFAAATSSFFQWRDKTCVALALRNTRHISDKEEKVEDKSEAHQINKQAWKVILKGALTAMAIMIVVMLIP